jgi:ABC-type dipeptide/oligopeptide/nickel transport system permease subunit
MRSPAAWLGIAVLAAVAATAALSPLTGYDVVADVDPARALAAPGAAHWLGTDHLGRDVLMRLLVASRAFVFPGLAACACAAALGVPAGAVSGWFGGLPSRAIRYAFTVVSGLPRFVLVLLALSIYGNRPIVLAIAAGCAYAPTLGEAIHERIEGLRGADFLAAHRAHGVPEWRLLLVHVLWGACNRLVARHLLTLFSFFLVLETTLSYLGFGVQQPWPSWGNMLAFDLDYEGTGWGALLAPAAAIWLVIASIAWVRDALSEAEVG